MNIDPNIVEMLTEQSWNDLKPMDPFNVRNELAPEITGKHRDMVRAYVANDFDIERTLRAMTNHEQGRDDLDESGLKWHLHLQDVLKKRYKALQKVQRR